MRLPPRNLGSSGAIRFRPRNEAGEDNFTNGLGEKWGQHYRKRLENDFERSMKMGYPYANFQADHAEKVLPLLKEVLNGSRSEQAHSQTATPL